MQPEHLSVPLVLHDLSLIDFKGPKERMIFIKKKSSSGQQHVTLLVGDKFLNTLSLVFTYLALLNMTHLLRELFSEKEMKMKPTTDMLRRRA